MIGMIIVGSMRQDEIGLEAANQADDLLPRFQSRQQSAIGMIEDIVGSADERAGGLGLGATARDERFAAQRLMASAAIGDADQFDLVAEATPQRGGAAGLVVGVVGVSAQYQNAEGLHGLSGVRGWKKSRDGGEVVLA